MDDNAIVLYTSAMARIEQQAGRTLLHPAFGTGWEVVLDSIHGKVTRRLKLLGVRLPLKQQISYGEVAKAGSFCRVSWWSHANSPFHPMAVLLAFGVGSGHSRTEMATKGWRWDINLTLADGRVIKLATVKTPQKAGELESMLRQEVLSASA